MFTGIITHMGTVAEAGKGEIAVKVPLDLIEQSKGGMSIAVNGACLTAVSRDADVFVADIMPETARRTTLGAMCAGTAVNLELPATPATFLSGHIVQGHVDTIGRIADMRKDGNSSVITVSFPSEYRAYVAEKGSIALDGVSLTVIEADDDHCTVGVIPHTATTTTLGALKAGDIVNIEFDILAKYATQLPGRFCVISN